MDVRIPREDGSALRCYRAGSAGPGVVVFHAWWGLNRDIIDLADRLGNAGFRIMAPDLFDGRTATTPEQAEQLIQMEGEEGDRLLADARRAMAHLRHEGVGKVATLGLSFGAPYAVAAAVDGTADAVVVFYGSTALEPEDRVAIPVLGHFADEDPYEPDGGEALFEQLQAAGATLEHHRYPETYHWFFEPSNEHYSKQAADVAWTRTLDFLTRHLAD